MFLADVLEKMAIAPNIPSDELSAAKSRTKKAKKIYNTIRKIEEYSRVLKNLVGAAFLVINRTDATTIAELSSAITEFNRIKDEIGELNENGSGENYVDELIISIKEFFEQVYNITLKYFEEEYEKYIELKYIRKVIKTEEGIELLIIIEGQEKKGKVELTDFSDFLEQVRDIGKEAKVKIGGSIKQIKEYITNTKEFLSEISGIIDKTQKAMQALEMATTYIALCYPNLIADAFNSLPESERKGEIVTAWGDILPAAILLNVGAFLEKLLLTWEPVYRYGCIMDELGADAPDPFWNAANKFWSIKRNDSAFYSVVGGTMGPETIIAW
jgi:hypothetical protein